MKLKFHRIDWLLLVLLVVVSNQAVLWLKFLALLVLILIRPNWQGLVLRKRLSLFIPLLMLVAALNFWGVVRDYSLPSIVSFGVSIGFWIAAFLGGHQVKTSIERNPQKIMPTLQLFTILNLLVSFGQVARIAWEQQVWNPYNSLPFPYGMSTGDLVFGILGEASYNNAFVCALLAVYFLFNRKWLFLVLCLFTELLVFGNVMLLSLSLVFVLIALAGLVKRWYPQIRFLPAKPVALAALASAGLLLLMIRLVSPENTRYILTHATATDSVREPVSEISEANTGAEPVSLSRQVTALDFKKYQRPETPADAADIAVRNQLTEQAVQALKGKKLSFLETVAYLNSDACLFLLGAGPGRFSSLTASRMSGLDSSRLFRNVLPQFSTRAYTENHRLIHIKRVSGDPAWLSNANWPDSFYNQLLGEYGLVGLVLFLACYVLRYLRRSARQSYSIWVSALLIPIALLTYLVEPLCVLFFYELLVESDGLSGPVQTQVA